MVNQSEVHVIFQDTEYQLQENILHHFLDYSFLWNRHEIDKYFYLQKIIYWKLLQHCPNI